MVSPFSDIRDLLSRMPVADTAAGDKALERDSTLTKPIGSLGKLESISHWLSMWSRVPFRMDNIIVAVFAGNHGVTDQGVSPFPREVTQQMVSNFTSGGAAINQICKSHNLHLKVFELSLDIPTNDISVAPAMDEKTCVATMAYGMEAIAEPCDLLCVGEMGIGNTTIASAIYLALFGGEAKDWVGPGTGHDESGVALKANVITRSLDLHRSSLSDPLEVLRCLGGREIAAMCGAILASRMHRIPVIIDGFVASSAAAILHSCDETALDHCLFSHISSEPGHIRALSCMGKEALLDLDMRLGECTGAALAAGIVRAAASCHTGMSTFTEASVTNRSV